VLLRYGGPQALEAAAAAGSDAAAAAGGEADAANAAGPSGSSGGSSAAAAQAVPGACAAGDFDGGEVDEGAWSLPSLLELTPDKHVDVLLAALSAKHWPVFNYFLAATSGKQWQPSSVHCDCFWMSGRLRACLPVCLTPPGLLWPALLPLFHYYAGEVEYPLHSVNRILAQAIMSGEVPLVLRILASGLRPDPAGFNSQVRCRCCCCCCCFAGAAVGGKGCCRLRQLGKPAAGSWPDSPSGSLPVACYAIRPLQGQPHVAVAAVHGHKGVLDVLCEHGGAVTLKALHHATDTRSIRVGGWVGGVVWVGFG
jgi:hypothetical protein